MRIYDTPHNLSSGATGETHRADRASSGKVGGKSAVAQNRADEVHLSEVASRQADASEAANREQRVAHLSAVYQSGTYSVDPEAVASSVVDDSTVMP